MYENMKEGINESTAGADASVEVPNLHNIKLLVYSVGRIIASILGRVFAFITVKLSAHVSNFHCICGRQKYLEMKMHSEYTKDAHIGSCFTKAWGSCQLCCSTITVTQGNFRMIECLQITFQKDLAGCWTSLILANS